MTRALVVTVSTRAAAGVYEDRSGPVLVDGLVQLGFEVDGPEVVADGDDVERVLRAAVQTYALVVTTGGTGMSPTDRTPEATRAVVDREVPGIAEALRARGVAAGIATSVLSRGIAAVAGQCLVVNLAGSPGAAKDGLEVLAPIVGHAIEQVAGGDHLRP